MARFGRLLLLLLAAGVYARIGMIIDQLATDTCTCDGRWRKCLDEHAFRACAHNCSFRPKLVAQLAMVAQRKPRASSVRLEVPVRWFHVPKTGTSFINTLYRSQCPALPDNATCGKATRSSKSPELLFVKAYPPETYCPQEVLPVRNNWRGGHHGLKLLEQDRSPPLNRTVALFRSPRPRTLSGYTDNMHDFPSGDLAFRNNANGTQRSVREYADAVRGMDVLMLLYNTYDWLPQRRLGVFSNGTLDLRNITAALNQRNATDGRVGRALDAFQFVGLTEEWNLSMCLWHRKFDRPCHPSSFVNMRKGSYHAAEFCRQVRSLHSWVDPYDEAVYTQAKRLFWRDVSSYHVSEATCRAEGCWPLSTNLTTTANESTAPF